MAAPGSTSAPKAPPPDLLVLLECVWLHKWKALAAACILAGSFGTVASLAIPARFKATSLVRLAAPDGLVERPHESTTPENFRLGDSRAYQSLRLGGRDLKTDIENLDYVPTGVTVAKTLPLLTDLRLRELVDELKRKYTCVVLDVAAAARFPDAVHLAWMVDVAILSAEPNISLTNRLLEAQTRLTSSGLPVFGLMIG